MGRFTFVLIFATLAETSSALFHASTFHAPTFLASQNAQAMLAAETRQEPKKAKAVDINKAPIGVVVGSCVFFAVFGSIFGCAGLGVMYGFRSAAKQAGLMTGDGVPTTTATITSRKKRTTTSRDSDGHSHTQHHFEASYWFEAVRIDGMRCRIKVTDRELGSNEIWESCPEGSQHKVAYFADDPQHCRLAQAALNDDNSSGGIALVGGTLFGSVFLAAGFFVGVVAMTQSLGFLGFLICGSVWFSLVGCCILGIVAPIIDSQTKYDGGDTSLEELGMQEPSSELGNISGTWSLQSDLGTFEYKFAVVKEKAVSLTVQGRLEGQTAWDPEYNAWFTDGRSMSWEDDQGTTFRVTFETAEKFNGSAKAAGGSELAFVGVRKG